MSGIKQNKANSVSQKGDKESVISFNQVNAIIENAGSGIYIVQDERIVFHNTFFSNLTGYTSEELRGMNFLEIVHPKDKKLIKLLFSNNFREINLKQPFSFGLYHS